MLFTFSSTYISDEKECTINYYYCVICDNCLFATKNLQLLYFCSKNQHCMQSSFLSKPTLSLLIKTTFVTSPFAVQWLRFPYIEYQEALFLSIKQNQLLHNNNLISTIVAIILTFTLGHQISHYILHLISYNHSLTLDGVILKRLGNGCDCIINPVPASKYSSILKALDDTAKYVSLDGEICIYEIQNTSTDKCTFCIPCIQKPYYTSADVDFNQKKVMYFVFFTLSQPPAFTFNNQPVSLNGSYGYQTIGRFEFVRIVAAYEIPKNTIIHKTIQYCNYFELVFDPCRCQIHALTSEICINNIKTTYDLIESSSLFNTLCFWGSFNQQKSLFRCTIYQASNHQLHPPSTKKRKLNVPHQQQQLVVDEEALQQIKLSIKHFMNLQFQLKQYSTSSFTNITKKQPPLPLPLPNFSTTTTTSNIIPKWELMHYLRTQIRNFNDLFITIPLNSTTNTIFKNLIQNNTINYQQIEHTLADYVCVPLAKQIVRYLFGSTSNDVILVALDAAIQTGVVSVKDQQHYLNTLSVSPSVFRLTATQIVMQDKDEESSHFCVYEELDSILYPMILSKQTYQALSRVHIFIVCTNDNFDDNHILIIIPMQNQNSSIELMVLSYCNLKFNVLNTFQPDYKKDDVITANNDSCNEILFKCYDTVTLLMTDVTSPHYKEKIKTDCEFYVLYSKEQNQIIFMFKKENHKKKIIHNKKFNDISHIFATSDKELRFDIRLGRSTRWIIQFNQNSTQQVQKAYKITQYYLHDIIPMYQKWIHNTFLPTLYKLPFLKCDQC